MKTEKILSFLKIISWIIFIGISMTTISLIIAFILSFTNSDLNEYFTVEENWYNLKEKSNGLYVKAMSFNIGFCIVHAYIWFLAVRLFSKLDLKNPFTLNISNKIELIAYQYIALGILSIVGNKIFSELLRQFEIKFEFSFDAGYIFMAGIIYIISQIFKRGIEIQQENELTV